jgi:DNA invertase Pin-like site-specific DNA recombinase
MVMTLFGGMSKGERSRIRTRVRSAMAAQAATQGRFLGGRPPYGYRLADAGPHPHPGKATLGIRIHRLEPDPVTAPVVARIFEDYVSGKGLYAIAEGPDQGRGPLPLRLRPGSQLAPKRRELGQERRPSDPEQPSVHGRGGLGPPAQRRGSGRRRGRGRGP